MTRGPIGLAGDAALAQHRDAIARVIAAGTMPPKTPLPEGQREILLRWATGE